MCVSDSQRKHALFNCAAMDTTAADEVSAPHQDDKARMDVSDSEEESLSSSSEKQDEQRINEYRERLNGNPYDFQSHFQLLRLLRNAAELEELRQRRVKFADLFPLPESTAE